MKYYRIKHWSNTIVFYIILSEKRWHACDTRDCWCVCPIWNKYPDIEHQWDIWHAAKNMTKKLSEVYFINRKYFMRQYHYDIH